jgi:ELMO/CED-12 family
MHSFAVRDTDTFAKVRLGDSFSLHEFSISLYTKAHNVFLAFVKMVLEQVHRTHERRCPFARASIEVTDLLSDYWNVTSNGK